MSGMGDWGSEAPAVVFDSVEFAYGSRPVFAGLGMVVQAGEMVGLLGRNGTGKTTWLKLACGLLAPTGGSVALAGRLVRDLPPRERARLVAWVPQELHMPFPFTVSEMVMLGRTPYLGSWGTEGGTDHKVVRRALVVTETTDLADRPFHDLSAGERQRVLLAMALAQEPRILLLDEPTAHLDAAHQVWAFDLVQRLNREAGLTVVAAVHDLQLAAWFCPRLAVLHGGALVSDGPAPVVLRSPCLAEALGISLEVRAGPWRPGDHLITLPR